MDLRKQFRKRFPKNYEIAERLGVHHNTLAQWLRGADCLGVDTLKKLERIILP
jgi:transcriptional regulator with XRE-family HTH domain|tara:strand:+ start:1823 stop:1981 length:159 start_codon:yes stop_codon:yes gene_type:complete